MKEGHDIYLKQIRATKVIKKIGARATQAILCKFSQLDKKIVVVETKDRKIVTLTEKKVALRNDTLVKENTDKTTKGRACSNGSK